MKNLLYIDCCVRGAASRTKRLAEHLIKACAHDDWIVNRLFLPLLTLPPIDAADLSRRNLLISEGTYDDPLFDLARQFKLADRILIAAPLWNLSFPSLLRVYLERLCINGLTFHYDKAGRRVGDCRADRLFYVTTRGGYLLGEDFASSYLRALCCDMLGVQQFDCLCAEGLDIVGNDPEAILQAAETRIDTFAATLTD